MDAAISSQPGNSLETARADDEGGLCEELCQERKKLVPTIQAASYLHADDLEATTHKEIKVASLGHRCISRPINGCSLCRFFHKACPEQLMMHEPLELRAVNYFHTSEVCKQQLTLVEEEAVQAVVLMVVPAWSMTAYKSVRYMVEHRVPAFPTQHLFFDRSPTASAVLFRPRIISAQAEMSLARVWLSCCRTRHDQWCSRGANARNPSDLKVIDCNTMKVIAYPASKPYVALSYVWGKKATGEQYSNTILDAAEITLALGFKYLWCDRHCIMQADGADRYHQIQQMDLIYSSADLTIIASHGQNAETGLPGVRNTRRESQPTFKSKDFTLINTHTHAHKTIRSSVWHTRAWTLQEAFLSRRRLVFTPQQMFFECECMNCHETVDYDMELLHTLNPTDPHKCLFQGIFPGLRNWHKYTALKSTADVDKQLFEDWDLQIQKYAMLRDQYSTRNLTYDSDALNAFLGILRHLQEKGSDYTIHHLWGIPFPPPDFGSVSEASGQGNKTHIMKIAWDWFLLNLLWQHDGESTPRRRKEFSTWSWVGWAGAVHAIEGFPNTRDMAPLDIAISLEYDDPRASGLLPSLEIIDFRELPIHLDSKLDHYSRPRALVLHADAVDAEAFYHKYQSVQEYGIDEVPVNRWRPKTYKDVRAKNVHDKDLDEMMRRDVSREKELAYLRSQRTNERRQNAYLQLGHEVSQIQLSGILKIRYKRYIGNRRDILKRLRSGDLILVAIRGYMNVDCLILEKKENDWIRLGTALISATRDIRLSITRRTFRIV